jgi:hypothetical protein
MSQEWMFFGMPENTVKLPVSRFAAASIFGRRIWESPGWMTSVNTLARILALLAVLPIVLRQFSPGDISLYYLLSSVITLQMLAAGGFVPTFARFISQVIAGVSEEEIGRHVVGTPRVFASSPEFDRVLLAKIVSTLSRVFLVLSLMMFPLEAVLGTLMLAAPVSLSSSPERAWIAWGVVAVITPISLFASQYSSVLQGLNRVAQEQRWSAVFVIVGSICGVIALACGGDLLVLIAVNQFWQLISFFRLRWLCSIALREQGIAGANVGFSADIFRAVWPSSWRSMLGVASAAGIAAGSGFLFAQRMPAAELSRFLLGQRIMMVVSEVSRAPFYSRIPVLNAMRAKGDIDGLLRSSQQAMQYSYAAFMLLFLVIPVCAAFAFPLIGSNTEFPAVGFWCLLGLSVLVERTGAMHLQVYSTTNDIVWHRLNGYTGLVWITLMLMLIPVIGIFSYPVAMLLANCAVYTQMSLRLSVRSLGCHIREFERYCSFPGYCGFGACCALLWAFDAFISGYQT